MIYLPLAVDLQVILLLLKLDLLVLEEKRGHHLEELTDIRKSFLNGVLFQIEYRSTEMRNRQSQKSLSGMLFSERLAKNRTKK